MDYNRVLYLEKKPLNPLYISETPSKKNSVSNERDTTNNHNPSPNSRGMDTIQLYTG
jgi:hypothetical protein